MEQLKELLRNKPRQYKWVKFLEIHNITNEFNSHKLYDDETYQETSYRIINNIKERPKCKACNNTVKFHHSAKYRTYCSLSCLSKYTSDKRLNTYKEKTGFNHPHHNPEVKKKMIKNSLEKYGVNHPSKLAEVIEKGKKTKLRLYGDENYNNSEKAIKTNIKKYGGIFNTWYHRYINTEIGYNPGIFYKLEFTHKYLGFSFLKVGITSKSINERYSSKVYQDYEYKIVQEVKTTNLESAILEREYVKLNKEKLFTFPENIKFKGMSECFIV